MPRIVATATSEPEAEMICSLLAEAGIRAMFKRSVGADVPGLGAAGARDVYVEDQDLRRAREVLDSLEKS
jgi:hypothetical protein